MIDGPTLARMAAQEIGRLLLFILFLGLVLGVSGAWWVFS